MADIGRRGFVKGATLGALAFTVGGAEILMAPGEARARGVPFRLLDAHQGDTLEALGETLVPQARESGIAHFIDQQLSVPAHESLLQARILNFRPPFAEFYRSRNHDGGRRKPQDVRQGFRASFRRRSARIRRSDAAKQDRRLDRQARRIDLRGASRRCRRCRLRNHGRLRVARYPLYAAYPPGKEVVR